MQFIDPRTDFAFKRIFGSEEGRDALVSMLNAVMGLQGEQAIDEVVLLDPYQPPAVAGLKRSFLDVKARDRQGTRYLIEMQVEPVREFAKRIVYNASKAYVGQLSRGADYASLTQVVAITFCDFVMFSDFDHYLSDHRVREQVTSKAYLDEVRYYFVELPKFHLGEDEVSTPLERWCFFLKHAGGLDRIPRSLSVEPYSTALHIAERSNLSREEWEAFDAASVYMQDQRGKIEYALDKGHRAGLEEGMEKGMEEGRRLEQRAIALRLLEAGMEAGKILELTGVDLVS